MLCHVEVMFIQLLKLLEICTVSKTYKKMEEQFERKCGDMSICRRAGGGWGGEESFLADVTKCVFEMPLYPAFDLRLCYALFALT